MKRENDGWGMHKLKILLASYFHLPSVGGLWNYMEQLARGLRMKEHEVDILARDPVSGNYYIQNRGFFLDVQRVKNVVSLRVNHFFKQQVPDMDPWIQEREIERYSYELAASYFNLNEYDLIHTQDIIATMALSRVKPKNTPLITTIHGSLHDEYSDKRMIAEEHTLSFHYSIAQEYFGATSSNITIVPSYWFKNYITSKFGIPDHHLAVVYHGIDAVQFFKRMQTETAFLAPPDKYILACVARLSPEKGHIYLLDALGQLKKNRHDWICWIIGDGPLRTELEQTCKHLNIAEEVIFLGDRDDVPALLNQADIFVLPSLQESLSYAVIEAQIAGKPIVTTDVGGLPEVVEHGKTGLLSSAGQSDPLCQNLARLLDDEMLRRNLAQNAKRFSERNWTLDTMIENTVNIYKRYGKTALERTSKGGET